MYRRQSVYNNPQDAVNSSALAAASALGRALSPDGREVDHTKIPFYNSPSRSASMANLNRSSSATNRHGSHSNSITRRNSMYVSTNEVSHRQERKKIIVPSFKKTTTNSDRRTASLPSYNNGKRNRNKVSTVEARNVQNTFQEFGGPQTTTINSNFINSISNRQTIKKYIPGPNGLIAIDVPVDDDIRRRQRGSHSLTTAYLDIRNPHGNNNSSRRSNSGLHNHSDLTHPRIRTRVSSDSLTNRSSSSSSRSSNNKTTSSINNNPHQKMHLTLNKQRSTSSLMSKRIQSENSSNITSGSVKHTKTNVANTKLIHHKETRSKNRLSASILQPNEKNVKKKETVSLPMIESSMPEETELELELDSGNVESRTLKPLNTPSKIELNELIEETIELEEKLNEDFILDDKLKSPNNSDGITNEQNILLDTTIGSEQTNGNEMTLDINNTNPQINNNNDNYIEDLDSIQKDDVSQAKEIKSTTIHNDNHIRDEGIEKSSNELLPVSNKFDVSSSFFEEEGTIDYEVENVNIEKSEEDISRTLSNDKSFNKENNVYENKDVDLLGNKVNKNKDKVVNEQQHDNLPITATLVSDELQQKQVEDLGLQMTSNPYLDGVQVTENVRDGSSDYVSTEEYPHDNTPDLLVPPPRSSKRHKEGVHSVTDTLQDVMADTSTITGHSSGQLEDLFNSSEPQQNSGHHQNKENILIKKNRTTMADYLRSANPYLNKTNNVTVKKQSNVNKKGTHSTPKKKTTESSSLSSPSKKPNTKYSMPSLDLKPPPRLGQNTTPIKSALKKTQSYNSDNSAYNDNPANDAYISLTTAENTRLNARMSNENLVSRKISVRKVKRPQSMVTQVAQKSQSPSSKDNKKKSSAIARHSSVVGNSRTIDTSKVVKRQSKIKSTEAVNTHEDLVSTKVKELVQDPRMSSILYPIEPIPKKSSFEKLRPERDHLGFKSLSLRTGLANEAEYEQYNTSNKFYQNKVDASYPINKQQRTQQSQPLTATIEYGPSSGWTSRFQDSDSDDDYTSPQYKYSKSNGIGSSSSPKVSSSSKVKGNGFLLFKNKKHHDLQKPLHKPSHETSNFLNNNASDKIATRTTSTTDQLTLNNKSGLKAPQQRIFSEPQLNGVQKIDDYQHIEGDDHKKAHKFGNKLKKLFGRKK